MKIAVETRATTRRHLAGVVPALALALFSTVALAQGAGSSAGSSSSGAGGAGSPAASPQAGPSGAPGGAGAVPGPAHRQPRPADVNRQLQSGGDAPDPAQQTEQRLEGSSRRAINSICRGC